MEHVQGIVGLRPTLRKIRYSSSAYYACRLLLPILERTYGCQAKSATSTHNVSESATLVKDTARGAPL